MDPVTTLGALKQDLASKPRKRGLTPISPELCQILSGLAPSRVEDVLPGDSNQSYSFRTVSMDNGQPGVMYVRYDDGYETPDDTLAC